MKAWVLHGVDDLRFEDVPKPEPRDGEVLVRVKCVGVCSSDVPRIFTTGMYSHPLIPGHEFSGELKNGRRVAAFPLLPCFSCQSCTVGSYETCSSYDYIGSRTNGAFAEYVAVPEWNLVDISDDMSFEAAAMLEPAAVAYHAAGRVDLTGYTSAAVIGDGIIGQLIAKLLTLSGIDKVSLIGRGDDTERCDNPALYESSFDVCYEAVGSVESFRRCVEIVRPIGKIVLIGNPSADFSIDKALYWQLLRKQIVALGIWNSRYPHDWEEVIKIADRLKLDEFITHRYPLGKALDALTMMRDKKEKHGKVMLIGM